MFRKPPPALVALERLLACVVPDVTHQRALLPEAPAAVLAHVGLVLQVRPEVNLLGILQHRGHVMGQQLTRDMWQLLPVELFSQAARDAASDQEGSRSPYSYMNCDAILSAEGRSGFCCSLRTVNGH